MTQAVSPSNHLALSDGEVAITGYHGNLHFQGPNDLDTLKAAPNQGYDAYIARFDTATGDLLGLISAETQFGDASYGYSIAADGEGGYYLGGNYNGRLYLGPDTLTKIGSQRSFFVARYACLAPAAGFSAMLDTATNGYVFAFSGEAGDSVVWDFGDGSPTVAGDTVSHIFPALGTYTVCATGHDECGDSTVCDTVAVTKIGLGKLLKSQFSIAPNPARDKISVRFQNSPNALFDVRLRDVHGKVVVSQSARGRTELNVSRLPSGLYFMEIERGGQRLVTKVAVGE